MTHQDFLLVHRIALSLLKKTKDKAHGLSHSHRVFSNAKKIFPLHPKLNLDLKILETSCLLHDISYTQYPASLWQYLLEARRSKKIASDILNQTSTSSKEKRIILNSTANHSHSFPFRQLNPHGSIYDQILQDADTLDLLYPHRTKSRFISFVWTKVTALIKKCPKLFLNFPESIEILNS